MAILADPTLLMTKRGLEWLLRASVSQVRTIRCPKSYVAAESGGLTGDGGPYWRRGLWAGRRPYYDLWPDLTDSLNVVGSNASAVSSLRLDRLKSPDREVIAEIWSGLLTGDRLVARRFVTFEALVQAGVIVVTRGPDDYDVAFAEATSDLATGLAAALDRRIRFIATTSHELDHFDRPALSIYDSGQRSYH